jgi:hypothetical protein
MGHYKPICQALVSNYEMVETIGRSSTPTSGTGPNGTVIEWEGYCRAALMTFRDSVDNGNDNHS